MKSQKFKRVIVVLLVTAMAVAIPSSFAKYADTVTIESAMTVKRKMFSIFNTYPGISKEEYIVRLPQVGYYAIIVKGGDGANGDSYSGDKTQGYKIEGGIGGTVVGVYQTTQTNQYLFVAPGEAGERPNSNCKPNVAITNPQKGDGGKNIAHTSDGKFAGGSGSLLDSNVLDSMAQGFSKAPAGGGGGAASLVYKCDEKGNYTSSDILMVAAGGGAGAVWNEGYYEGSGWTNVLGTADPAGFGGDGGSNFFDGKVSALITYASSKYAFSFASIYDGFNGTGTVSSIDTRGKAGTSAGAGAGATSSAGGVGGLLVSQTSSSGKTFANGGNGGSSVQYGGGGGAGYNGGSGGTSTSVRNQGWLSSTKQPAGGGGGGASYVASSVIQTEKVDYASIISSVSSGDKSIPMQYPQGVFTADGDGYVIIKYLGTSLPTGNVDVMASAMSRYIVQKYNNSDTIDTITNTTSTSNAFYKTLMNDTAISNFLSGRAWSIGYGQCDHVNIKSNVIPILYFSEKNLTVANGATITVWRYKEGELSKATNVKVSRSGTKSPYTYSLNNPSAGTYTKADFALN